MLARSHDDLDRVRGHVERLRKVSDRVIGIGPFGIGLDGLSAWIPGAGAVYSVVAGGLLMMHGLRARASLRTLAGMAGILLADSLLDVIPVPIAPAVADMLFTGQKWASDALLKHMDKTVYYEGTRAEADADPYFREHLQSLAAMRRGAPKQRIVYLR